MGSQNLKHLTLRMGALGFSLFSGLSHAEGLLGLAQNSFSCLSEQSTVVDGYSTSGESRTLEIATPVDAVQVDVAYVQDRIELSVTGFSPELGEILIVEQALVHADDSARCERVESNVGDIYQTGRLITGLSLELGGLGSLDLQEAQADAQQCRSDILPGGLLLPPAELVSLTLKSPVLQLGGFQCQAMDQKRRPSESNNLL